MTRYLGYSTAIHAAGFLLLLLWFGRAEKPTAYYGFQFLGGQSGFGTGKLEPAPAPLAPEPIAEPAAPAAPAAPVAEPPAPAENVNQVAVAPKPEEKKPIVAPEKKEEKKPPPKKSGVKGGRGDSPLGRGDIQGAKTGPVGGVGTSLEIGGFGPGGGGAAAKQFPFKWYGELIYRRLWEAWDRTDAGTRECKVAFTLLKDGNVTGVKVKSSSGDAFFDMTAKRAVSSAAPFPPLPEGFKEKELPVLVRFRLQ
jgi:protein TonB